MRIQMKNSEEPFVRMVKRDRLTGMQAWRIRMIAVLLALLAGAVLFLASLSQRLGRQHQCIFAILDFRAIIQMFFILL